MTKKKLTALILAVLMLVALIPNAAAVQDPPVVNATSTVVIDAYSGQVIYEHNADEKRPIASITKIMTGYLACEELELDDPKLDEIYTISQHAADADGNDGSTMYFLPGDQVSYEVLLYGTMLRSGNDAASALAEACADGDEAAFIQKMNEKAEEIGMTNTHFSSCNGLQDEDNYSTARDMAKLAKLAMENELFSKVVGTWYIELGDYPIENHNELLAKMRGECLGIKTGFTTAAGRTLVSCAERNGSKFIIVTLNDSYDYDDHMALYEWAFENHPANVLCAEGEVVTNLHVGNQKVPLIASETLVASVPQSSENEIECYYELPETVTGAVSKGAVAGKAVYTVNGEMIGSVELLYNAILVN